MFQTWQYFVKEMAKIAAYQTDSTTLYLILTGTSQDIFQLEKEITIYSVA
jgi:hypothetical protein